MKEHPLIKVDRAGMARQLREIANGLETGFVAAFKLKLGLMGVGSVELLTSEERHPDGEAFDLSDVELEDPTPPTGPGSAAAMRKRWG